MHRLKFLDKKPKRIIGCKQSDMKHPKIGVMLGYMIPVIPSSMNQFCCRCDEIASTANHIVDRDWSHPFVCVVCVCGEALFHGYNKLQSRWLQVLLC